MVHVLVYWCIGEEKERKLDCIGSQRSFFNAPAKARKKKKDYGGAEPLAQVVGWAAKLNCVCQL